jgi:hypothetical protein
MYRIVTFQLEIIALVLDFGPGTFWVFGFLGFWGVDGDVGNSICLKI